MKRILIVLAIYLIGTTASYASSYQIVPNCAYEDLYNICKRFWMKTSHDEIIKLCQPANTTEGLYNGAKAMGLHAYIAKISLDDLAKLNLKAVLVLNNGHSAALLSSDNKASDGREALLELQHAINDPYLESKEALKQEYAGLAVVVSKKEEKSLAEKRQEPDIRCDRYYYDLGSMESGSKVNQVIKIQNSGKKDLCISKIGSTPSGIEAPELPRNIAPGKLEEVTIIIDTSGLVGEQMFFLQIESNDPVAPILTLRLVGIVNPKSQ